MKDFDIAVVGGGAAGMMAAIRAGQLNKKVALLERNDTLGKKVLLTGKGRCNITNSAPVEVFIEKFGRQGEFLRSAFFRFFNEDLADFFRAKGLELKTERQGRVFPVTDSARSVVSVLKEYLADNKVEILYKAHVIAIYPEEGRFLLDCKDSDSVSAKKVILASGGASYAATGSTGDGFDISGKLGHTIVPLRAGLVPLKTMETWVKDLQGLALEHIRVTFEYGKKRKSSDIGELMFTHFGVSGPIILDYSAEVVSAIGEGKEVKLFIDLKPGMTEEQLESRLLHKLKVKGNIHLKNFMKDLLPQRLIQVFLNIADISLERKTSQIKQDERRRIIRLLKALPLSITGSLPIEEAMVTGGGVSTKDINPRTMESRRIPGLYFAGEIIEGLAASGGYNLQQAFSTGYLAGESAAKCVS